MALELAQTVELEWYLGEELRSSVNGYKQLLSRAGNNRGRSHSRFNKKCSVELDYFWGDCAMENVKLHDDTVELGVV